MRIKISMFLILGVITAGVCWAQSDLDAQNPSGENDASAFADFQVKANAWRALPQKPAFPEEARRFRVLANDAVQNKDFEGAVNYYEQGLAIDPMWPTGQFNAALIYAELERYPLAVMHMKRYLALVPDAQDARSYQDKIYVWEEKGKREGWVLGTWGLNWDTGDGRKGYYGKLVFMKSDTGGVVAIGLNAADPMYKRPFFRGTFHGSGEISWEVYLNPVEGIPSGWNPVISCEVGSDKRTMKILVPSQWADQADSNNGSFQKPMIYTLTKDSDDQDL